MRTIRLHLMVFVAVSAMIFSACDNGQKTLIITEKGVEPFLMDSCFLDIPPRGSFYDTILLNRYYIVSVENERFDILESKLRTENKMRMNSYRDKPYDKIEGYYGIGAVMHDKDTLLVVKYNEQATIYSVEILSDLSKVKTSKVSKRERDENYKAALCAQMSDLKKMKDVAQNGGFGDKEQLLKWMQGTWTFDFEIGDHDTPVSDRLEVDGEMITKTSFGVEGVPGTIKYYDTEKGCLIFGEGTRLEFDNKSEIIYYNRIENWVYERQTTSSQGRIGQDAQLNGIWKHQRFDNTNLDIVEETLTFQGGQYMYRLESLGGRAMGGRWTNYSLQGNKIIVDGHVLFTIDYDGNIKRNTDNYIFEKVY